VSALGAIASLSRLGSLTVATALAVTATARAEAPKFSSSWKAPEAYGVSFAGKKVAALVITSDENLRTSGEEQLVRELTARGIQGIATYRMIPREETATAERARPWFERAAVDGVVALRPVSAEKQTTYTPSVWSTTTYYTTLWGYYGYGWSAVYSPGGNRTETRLVVETLIYSMPLDKLLWAGVSTTNNPKEAQAFIKDLVAAAVKEMKNQGLVK
jgi:hypothetical protein